MPDASATRPTRRRRTVVLNHGRVQALLDEALAPNASHPADLAARHLRHLALLQAYTEAAQPAGGLPLDAQGRPLAMAALAQRAEQLAQAGEAADRMMDKLRRSRPMDLRLAEAVLQALRTLLKRPGLDLEHLGAVEGQRHASLQRLERTVRDVRDDVPQSILRAFLARSEEAAAMPVALLDYRRSYRALQLRPDTEGVQRLHLEQVNRYRPLRLVPFAARHRLQLAAEWHHWARTPVAELRLWPLDAEGQPGAERRVALHKHMSDGLVITGPDPALEADLVHGLPLADTQGRDLHYQVEWRLRLVLNAADRDMLVNYAPVVQPEIELDPASQRHFELQVGDSPGLVRTSTGWRLDRTLLPREVLALRLRPCAMTEADALGLSPTGEWRLQPQG